MSLNGGLRNGSQGGGGGGEWELQHKKWGEKSTKHIQFKLF